MQGELDPRDEKIGVIEAPFWLDSLSPYVISSPYPSPKGASSEGLHG